MPHEVSIPCSLTPDANRQKSSHCVPAQVPKAASWKGHMYLPLMICWPMQFTPDSMGEGKYPESQYPK